MKGAKVIYLRERKLAAQNWCCDDHKKGYLLLASENTPEQKRIAIDVLRRAEARCQKLTPDQFQLISKEMAVFL